MRSGCLVHIYDQWSEASLNACSSQLYGQGQALQGWGPPKRELCPEIKDQHALIEQSNILLKQSAVLASLVGPVKAYK